MGDEKHERTFLEKVTTIHGTNQFQLKSGRSKLLWWLSMAATLVVTIIFIIIVQENLRNDRIYTKIRMPNVGMLLGILPGIENYLETISKISKVTYLFTARWRPYSLVTWIHHALSSNGFRIQVDSTCQVNQAPFPCVSICNLNMVSKKETANIARLLQRHNRSDKEIDKFLEDLPKLQFNTTPDADNATEIMDILKGYYYTMDTIMEEVYQKCENLLLYCEFNRRVKNCFDIFSLIKTVEGHCCAFNYAALNDVSEVSLLPHDDTLEYYDGDEESDHVSGTIITTSESGRSSGLTVVFNVEPDDYPTWSKAHNYGAQILISDPNDFPETSMRDTLVTIGSAVDVKVEPRVFLSESDVRRVTPTRRACWFHDEVSLEHTNRYSYETCVTECVMANFIASCGCTPYKYPRDESRRFCELRDLPCTYNITVNGNNIPCDPLCYVECRDKGYVISKNTVPFDASSYPAGVTSGKNLSHLSSIKVYFGKSTCSCYKMTLLMDVTYFIATYGGVLGLSFGASLLTFAELLYLIFSTLCIKLARFRNNYEQKRKIASITEKMLKT